MSCWAPQSRKMNPMFSAITGLVLVYRENPEKEVGTREPFWQKKRFCLSEFVNFFKHFKSISLLAAQPLHNHSIKSVDCQDFCILSTSGLVIDGICQFLCPVPVFSLNSVIIWTISEVGLLTIVSSVSSGHTSRQLSAQLDHPHWPFRLYWFGQWR